MRDRTRRAAFASAVMLLACSGCGARRIHATGDPRVHPRVKWVVQSGTRLVAFLGVFPILMRESFNWADLYNDRLVVSSTEWEEVVGYSCWENVYVIDPKDGRIRYTITFPVPRKGVSYHVVDGKLVFFSGSTPSHARDLKTGRWVAVPETKPGARERTLPRIEARRGAGPEPEPSPDPVTHTFTIDLPSGERLIQAFQAESKACTLYLESPGPDGCWRRSCLVRLRDQRPSHSAQVGRDPEGDLLIVLRSGSALGIRRPAAPLSRPTNVP